MSQEVVVYIHGVSPRGQKSHDGNYRTLHDGIRAATPAFRPGPLLGLLVGGLGVSCQNTNFVVDPATVCRCNVDVDDPCFGAASHWSHAVSSLLEVSATDFSRGDFVGDKCQGETATAWDWPPVNFNSWRPVTGFKSCMLGTLHHFNWNYDDDEDWNLHVVPSTAFSSLISEVEALHSESADEHDKCGDSKCMEMEISPDKQFWDNPWFFVPGSDPRDTDSNGYSWLEGREMGFYGLWIMDANHDFKSEIHPANMMWFKDHFEGGFGASSPFDIFWLLFMQDNTGRFDDRDNFDCDGDAPSGWEPWEQSPKSGQFNIAFEVDPTTETVRFSIVELFNRFVVTSEDIDARQDADNGTSHALEYNGRIVVEVEETQPNDDDLGVTFTDICVRPNGIMQGFVSIRSKIGGDDDKDEEGFHVLYVVRSRKESPIVPRPGIPKLVPVLVTSTEVDGSLKRQDDYFTGDFRLGTQLEGREMGSDATVAKVEFVDRQAPREVKFEAVDTRKEILVRDVPLTPGGRLMITALSGRSARIDTPALVFGGGIHQAPARFTPDPAAGKHLAACVEGLEGAATGEDHGIARIQETQLQVRPRYEAWKRNEVLTDKASPLASSINRIIAENDQAALQSLFGSNQPFTIKWTFEATNLVTAKPVPVLEDGNAGTDGIRAQLHSDKIRNDAVTIQFPADGSGEIIECLARATLVDNAGHTATAEHRLWSHGFFSTVNTLDECTELVQALSGRDVRASLREIDEHDKSQLNRVLDAGTRHAYIIQGYLREAVRDKVVTIGELGRIIRALTLLDQEPGG